MRDGHTRKLTQSEPQKPDDFFRRFRATLVIVEGPSAGTEYPLDRQRIYVGRGHGADLRLDDPAMSEEHAALELTGEGFRVRDLGSTNGVHVNGAPVLATELKHGDRLQLGSHHLQFLLEKLNTAPRTYVLSDDS
jgi:pSer/pThr/pTyr-binding forkhead associated (FHA) protein